MKQCKTCKEAFTIEDFYGNKGGRFFPDGSVRNFKSCVTCRARGTGPWKNHNISEARYRAYGTQCMICLEQPGKLVIDHDHACCPGATSCGQCVRGLLCASCNWALGHFRDDPQRIVRAVFYLDANLTGGSQ